ncbi:MAG: hypothetical protein IPP90_11450 [Gemmatimonadaceae bacterium]|nr:hypothetical protein [Gemmatimonadaceae bacterium]
MPSAQAQFTAVGAPNGVIRGTITGSGAALVTVADAAVRGGGVHRRLTGYAANIQPPAAVRTKPARAPLPRGDRRRLRRPLRPTRTCPANCW